MNEDELIEFGEKKPGAYDSLLAFVTGDLFTMVSAGMMELFENTLWVAIAGFVGGFMGLAGKGFYKWLERRISKEEEIKKE